MMAEPIPYLVKSGDTYSSIAKKLGLKDWHNLKNYHNQHAGFNKQVGNTLYANTELLTPPPDEVAVLNGETDAPENEEKIEQKQAEQKQQDEKKKEDEQKKQEQAAKGEHDGKYFVVHGAKCVCDKAEDPTKTADLQVTTHNIIVLNDQSGKYLATEDDKTFIPPAATFGKCTLKPSFSGNLSCVLAAAPKWNKSYESTQVQGKKSLTEISELLCTTGGKITIKKHGQTDSVTNAHADNTNPLELAMVNPAVGQPVKKTEYPSVASISVTQVENRHNFKAITSQKKEIIYLRKGEVAKFEAKLSKGNKQLTSWVVYNNHAGKKENKILVCAQIGTEFSQSFEQYGKYRIEGYGKPKSPDFEKGKYDKCDPTCSIDIEVIENVLYDLECATDSFSNRLDGNKKLKFRQNFPVSFNAKFRMPRNSEEKNRLRMYALDGAGNVLTNTIVQGVTLTLTPQNSKAVYTIVAEYTTETGEIITKKISGETESNTVVGISHSEEVVRPGTSLTFHVEKMRYDFIANDLEFDNTRDEIAEIKWNLNGKQIGAGRSITIPGNMLLTPQKYVVEAYCKMANAFGTKAKHEEDDWHFEVKHNDIISYQKSGSLKVGKIARFSIGNNDLIFKNLATNENIYWNIGGKTFQGHYVDFTPTISGVVTVRCYINSQKGIIKSEPIVEAKITEGFWNDFGGSEISRASWGQTVDYCIKGENIEGEKIELHIYDDDNPPNDDDFAYSNTENNLQITGTNKDSYAYHRIELSDKIKERTTNFTSDEVKLYAKAKLIGFDTSLTDVAEKKDTQKHLKVNNKEEVYRAIIGDQNGRLKHNPVDYDIISYVYANTTYPKGTKLKVKIFEDINWSIDLECKELEITETVKEDGTLVAQINWGKLKDAKQNKKTKKYYAVIYDKDDSKLLDGSNNETICSTVLTPQSDLLKEASYVGAVTVGSEQVQQSTNGTCVCQQNNLVWGGHPNVSCDFRKKVVEISKRQNFDPNDLMAVMKVETSGTFSPSKIELKPTKEKRRDGTYKRDYRGLTKDEIMQLSENFAGAVGLIQFTPVAISSLNKNYNLSLTKRKLALMSQLDQLDYVEKYIELWKKIKNITTKISISDLYVLVFAPNYFGSSDDTTLYKEGSDYYTANASVDTDGKNGITKREIAARAISAKTEGLANKEKKFSCGQSSNVSNNATIMSDADIEFHIFSTVGEIQYKIKNEKREIAAYFYHDAKGIVHDIGKQMLKKISNKYGGPYKDRIKGDSVYLIDIRKLKNYKNGNIKYTLVMNPGTNRFFMNDVTLAAFIGAMLDCSFDDFTFNGFSDSEGRSIGGSKSHKNGMNGDLRYLRKDKSGQNVHLTLSSATGDPCGWKGMDEVRQNQFNNALYKYGWKSMLSWKFDNGRLLNHCTQYDDHYHHLHVQSFTPKLKEIK